MTGRGAAALVGLVAVATTCATVARTHAREAQQVTVRPPAVAGTFYPAEPGALGRTLDTLLAGEASARVTDAVAIVAPHAGWVFSGQVAADAFRQVRSRAYDLVVIVAPNHTRAGFDGIAVLPGAGMRTPLGVVALDQQVGDALVAAGGAVKDAGPHEAEHGVEVELPFVQRLWPQATVVAVVVGTEDVARCVHFGRALAAAVAGRRALLVASSDLSHYPPAAEARRVDARTLESMTSLDPQRLERATSAALGQGGPQLVTAACGRAAIYAVMAAARALGATRGTVVRYATSADVPAGDPSRVVGYGAVVFEGADPAPTLTAAQKDALLALARETIARQLGSAASPAPAAATDLARTQGAFVTVRKKGELRGCIGRLEGDRPLPALVRQVALDAAFHDPRFPPLDARELREIALEISVPSAPRAVGSPAEIVVGRDGVVLRKGGAGAVFLPQVATEQGWDRETLLDNLCLKAGLPAACWRAGAALSTFQADVFAERR